MGLYTFIYSHDSVFEAVMQESSLLAIRQVDKEGNPLFDALVYDEANLNQFREHFLDARAQVIPVLSRYMRDIPVLPEFREAGDHFKNREFVLHVSMPNAFDPHQVEPVDTNIRQFLVAYIMFRWLETKLPNVASAYLLRANSLSQAIKKQLDRRTRPVRRRHGLW